MLNAAIFKLNLPSKSVEVVRVSSRFTLASVHNILICSFTSSQFPLDIALLMAIITSNSLCSAFVGPKTVFETATVCETASNFKSVSLSSSSLFLQQSFPPQPFRGCAETVWCFYEFSEFSQSVYQFVSLRYQWCRPFPPLELVADLMNYYQHLPVIILFQNLGGVNRNTSRVVSFLC